MISCQVSYLRTTRDGREIRREAFPPAADAITLGSGRNCHVRLHEGSTRSVHAVITRADGGGLLLRAEEGATLEFDDRRTASARLEPGVRFSIGATSITVAEVGGERIWLVVAEAGGDAPRPARSRAEGQSAPTPGHWWLGAGFAGAILLLFIGALFARHSPAFEAWQARQAVILSKLFSPGPLAPAHALFEARCSNCHREAFVEVGDKSCLECHSGQGMHREPARPSATPIREPACIACHIAHPAKSAATDTKSAPCVACHERLESRLASARDFGTAHAPFRLTIFDGRKYASASADGADGADVPREKPNLKFSHAAHLKPEGISSPEGQTVLDCTSCHRLGEAGRSYQAPAMVTGCQQSGCHRIRFAEPMRGPVPHASVREIMDRMRVFYSNRLANEPEEFRQLCRGTARDTVRSLPECATELARAAAARTLFRSSGDDLACALCHEITETGQRDAPWRVTPVRWTTRWHASAEFPHGKHATMKCGGCHEKAKSTDAADVSLPGIGKCRECHAGSRGSAGRLATGCADCHEYHRHQAANR